MNSEMSFVIFLIFITIYKLLSIHIVSERTIQGNELNERNLIDLKMKMKLDESQPWNLPVVPKKDTIQKLVESYNKNKFLLKYTLPKDKRIPRNLFIGFRNAPPLEDIRYYNPVHSKLIDNIKDSWNINLIGQVEMDHFMSFFFADTSTLWFYNNINDGMKVATSDIFRYALLYVFGGVYLDDDCGISDLDNHIYPNDSMIVSNENNVYEECYDDKYTLSSKQAASFYNIQEDKALASHNNRPIIQWALMSEPFHPILQKTLVSIVDLLKHEYFLDPVANPLSDKGVAAPSHHGYRLIICITGPSVYTANVRDFVLSSKNSEYSLRFSGLDYAEFNGMYEVKGFRIYNPESNALQDYLFKLIHGNRQKTIRRHNKPLLKQYFINN